MKYLLEFTKFVNESNIWIEPERFPWEEQINALAQELIEKSEELKDKFDWNRHKTQKFEFEIKTRNWPDVDELIQEFGLSENGLEHLWNEYLASSLEQAGNDIVESSDFLTDWYQGGRSGGWLLLETDLESVLYPDSVVENIIDDYVWSSRDITDEEYEQWKSLNREDHDVKKGVRLLTQFNILDFETINLAEEESKKIVESLKKELEQLNQLEVELNNVQDRINSFWKNVDQSFREYVQYESERD